MGIRQRFEHGKASFAGIELGFDASGGECVPVGDLAGVVRRAVDGGLGRFAVRLEPRAVGCGRFVGIFRHFLCKPADYCRIVP